MELTLKSTKEKNDFQLAFRFEIGKRINWIESIISRMWARSMISNILFSAAVSFLFFREPMMKKQLGWTSRNKFEKSLWRCERIIKISRGVKSWHLATIRRRSNRSKSQRWSNGQRVSIVGQLTSHLTFAESFATRFVVHMSCENRKVSDNLAGSNETACKSLKILHYSNKT